MMRLSLALLFLGQRAAASSIVRQEVNYHGDQTESVREAGQCTRSDISTCCPHDLPNAHPQKVPHDVLPGMDNHWKLQLPCEEISEDGGLSTCANEYQELLSKDDSPGIATVDMDDLSNFILMPKSYKIGNKDVCTGAMYPAVSPAGDDMVVLHVPVAGTTTSGSDNPRIELRQMQSNDQMAGFRLTDGTKRTLETTISVEHVPAKSQSTSVVQIFNGGYKAPSSTYKDGGPFIEVITQECRYSWQKLPNGRKCTRGKTVIGVWKDGKFGGKGGFLFEEYELGTKFDLHIDIEGNGKIVFKYKHSASNNWIEKTIDCENIPSGERGCLHAMRNKPSKYPDANGLYWKVGNYLQKSYAEDPDDFALVYLYKAEISGR